MAEQSLDEMRRRLASLREATEEAYKLHQEKALAGWHGQPLAGFLRHAKYVERRANKLAEQIAATEEKADGGSYRGRARRSD